MQNVSAFFLVLSLFVSFVPSVVRAELVTAAATATVPPEILKKARELRLAEREEWRRLLHYRKGFFGGWTSEADGMNFFVASHGRTDPTLELEATLAGFFSAEKRALEGEKQPAQSVRCQFPARFEFLDHELHLEELVPTADCKEFDEFHERLGAKSITLVFSSFYAGNPSSTFGHSLIRMNRSNGADGGEHHQLLDSGINYAANQTTSNPIFYSIYGLIGVFRGTFTSIPYYYKVREYGDFESRDLWEYDLDLKPDEVERFVSHLWELGSTYFDYYFLSENCSYHMLTMIEAAAPRTHVVRRVPSYVIPTDTIKAIFEDGLVRKTNFRASLYSQFLARKARLSGNEEKDLRRLVASDRETQHPAVQLPANTYSPEARARISDAYMDYVDLQYAKQLYKKDEAYTKPKEALLVARSKLPMTSPLDFSTPPIASPNEGHPSARMSLLRVENQNHGGATDFAVRSAFHDLIDPAKGLPDADIDFFHLQLRYWDRPQRLRIEHGVLFGVGTFPPLNPYLSKLSWRAKIGIDRVDDARCSNCLAGGVYGGAGYSYKINLGFEALTYALIDAEGFTSPDFVASKFSLRGGPTLGLRLRLTDAVALLTEFNYSWAIASPSFDDYKIDTRLRWVPVDSRWGLDLHGLWKTENREIALGLIHYF